MLEEFRVDNFKSLINVTFRPHEWSLLLGANNAGKTTLCQALRFLSATTRDTLDKCAERTTGTRVALTNRYFSKPTIDFCVRASVPYENETLSFDYKLAVMASESGALTQSLEVDTEVLRVTGFGFDDMPLLENTRNGVRLLHETDYVRGINRIVETVAPRDATILNRLYDSGTNSLSRHFKDYLCHFGRGYPKAGNKADGLLEERTNKTRITN